LKEPKLAQMDKVFYKRFTAQHSKGKLMTGPAIIEKAKYFYDEMKIIHKCTFSEGWMQNFKEPAAKEDIQIEYSSD
jgi:hypothetical protein